MIIFGISFSPLLHGLGQPYDDYFKGIIAHIWWGCQELFAGREIKGDESSENEASANKALTIADGCDIMNITPCVQIGCVYAIERLKFLEVGL